MMPSFRPVTTLISSMRWLDKAKKGVVWHLDRLSARFFPDQAASTDPHDVIGLCRLYFCLTVIFYFAFNAVVQPGLLLNGDMWAEMATNYYEAARSTSWYAKLLTTDTGYIPFPQRLIALLFWAVGLPVKAIPYFYTITALLCSSLMVGVFCLPRYRKLIQSDALRFSMCLAVLFICDFETKTFINFTYHAVFFVAIVTALALTDRKYETAFSSWVIPVLMASKPAMLAVLPAMLIGSIVSLQRFRWVVLATVFFCTAQVYQIFLSRSSGVMATEYYSDPAAIKLWNAARYFFAFLSGYVGGPKLFADASAANPHLLIVLGFVLAAGLVGWILIARPKGGALIAVALSMAFCAMLINCFALPASFNRTMSALAGLPVHRQTIVNLFAALIILGTVVGSFISSESGRFGNQASAAGAVLFLGGLILSGWVAAIQTRATQGSSPITNNSHWNPLAAAIETGKFPLCVPIDPFGWIWRRDCEILNKTENLSWLAPRAFRTIGVSEAGTRIELTLPPELANASLQSVGILMKPLSIQPARIHASIVMNLDSGETRIFKGEAVLALDGALVYLSGVPGEPVYGVKSAHLTVDAAVQLSVLKDEVKAERTMLWMGTPR
jgi:hypothetical protein